MEDAGDDVDPFRAGTQIRLLNIEDWMKRETESVSQHLRDFEDRLKELADRVTVLESQVQAVDRDVPALRGRTTELRAAIEIIRAEAARGLFTDVVRGAGPRWQPAPDAAPREQ